MAQTSPSALRSESLEAARIRLLGSWGAYRSALLTAEPVAASAQQIEALLADPEASWDDLNLAELLLVEYMSLPDVEEAIQRRIAEALRRLVPDAAANAARFAKWTPAEATEPAKRNFLRGMIADLQHFGLRSKQVRRLRASAIGYVSWLSGVALVLALVPFGAFLLYRIFPGYEFTNRIDQIVSHFPNYGLYTAVSFGFLGALFSRFLQLQKDYVAVPLDDAEAYYRKENISLRLFVGTVAAMIVYFFAASGLVEGSIVPDVRQLAYEGIKASFTDGQATVTGMTVLGTPTSTALVPAKNLALLVIWAFVAGFSEQLVPDLLSSTTTRINSAAAKETAKP